MDTYVGVPGESPRIGKLRRVPLRDVWTHEASSFTPWLQDNFDELSAETGVQLSSVERKQPPGDFGVDLLAEDDNGDLVVIQSQLERSDHDHLGELITCLAAYEAKAAIWIVGEPRPEHVRAVAWLNESTAVAFYLVKVEAVRIEDSPPAPAFTLIIGPSIEARQMARTKKDLGETHLKRQQFWTQLLELANKTSDLHMSATPGYTYYLHATPTGVPGLHYSYVVLQHDARVDLYVNKSDAKQNKAVFDSLYSHRQQVEEDFGEQLIWQRLEGKHACRILHRIALGGLDDLDQWPRTQKALVDAMVRFVRALRPFVSTLGK